MSPPFDTGVRQTLPLLIFWEALGPGGQPDDRGRVEGGHLFSIPAPEDGWKITMPSTRSNRQDFPELWAFSVRRPSEEAVGAAPCPDETETLAPEPERTPAAYQRTSTGPGW